MLLLCYRLKYLKHMISLCLQGAHVLLEILIQQIFEQLLGDIMLLWHLY